MTGTERVPPTSGASRAVSRRAAHARGLFSGLAADYDRMGALLSFGQDPRWRRFMVSRLAVGPGERVLDVATGTGLVARRVARETGASVVAVDQSEPMLRAGVAATRRAPDVADRVRFALAQAERLPFADGRFDAVTFTYLIRYVDDPAATLRELARVLRPGATLANLEFHVPPAPLWRLAWWLYTRLVMPLAGSMVSRSWYEVGRFLGPSISALYRRHPLVDQLAMWRRAGIRDVRARVMSLGGGVVIWGTKSDGG